jgi:hypothetical protein
VKKTHIILTLVVTIPVTTWLGNGIVKYFSYHTPPHITLKGVDDKAYYTGTVACTIAGASDYKIATITISLDGTPLDIKTAHHIGAPSFERSFDLDTAALADGKHTLALEAYDSSYHQNKISLMREFFIDNKQLKSAFLQSEYIIEQGRSIHAQLQTNKPVKKLQVSFLSHTYECYPESEGSTIYEAFIPTDCEDIPNEYLLTAHITDAVDNTMKLTNKVKIKQAEFKKAKGFSVAKGKLDSEKEVSMNSKILQDALLQWLKDSPKQKLWSGQFIAPCEILRISTPFGEIRTTAEKGRYHHAAVDIINHPKSTIWAAQDGKVIIKDRFLMSGNTVVLDHGLGVTSLYFHLENFADIEVGDMLKKGTPLGRLGMTGYASGPHLHWEIRINNRPVDPLQWTEKTF